MFDSSAVFSDTLFMVALIFDTSPVLLRFCFHNLQAQSTCRSHPCFQTVEGRHRTLPNHHEFKGRNDEPLLEAAEATGYILGMDLELLQSISLAVSQARTVDSVLKMIVDGLVEKAGFALARIWLTGPGDICATCPMGGECPSRVRCLHLAASAGRSRVDGTEWTGIDGAFRRIPLGVLKIGQVGSTGKSFLIDDAALHPELTMHPEW